MPIKKLTLGLLLVLGAIASARETTYHVKNGDSLSSIAHRFDVSVKQLVQANGLADRHRLKLGQSLRIPSSAPARSASGGYRVRKGDFDWSIARREGISVARLHNLNPDVKWDALQAGQFLRTEGKSAPATTTVAAKRALPKAGKTIRVRAGDNDWAIAHRAGVSLKTLRALNPTVDFSPLAVGTYLRVPGPAGSGSRPGAVAAKTIRTRRAVVARDGATIRRDPGVGAEAIVTVSRGTEVRVLGREGAWYKLRFPKGTEGWVRGDLLAEVRATDAVASAPKRAKRTEVARVATKPKVKVKIAKKKAAPRYVASAPKRRRPTTVASRPAARYAYNDSGDGAPNVVARAENWRGVRYRYGAMSRSATDCSGFTGQVYRSVGARLPRTSSEQSKVGAGVSRGALKAGDLVFFRTTRGRRIGHVGIYVGNGKFIHASSGGGKVQENSLNEGYYRNRFVTARRVLKSSAKKRTETARADAPKAAPARPAAGSPVDGTEEIR